MPGLSSTARRERSIKYAMKTAGALPAPAVDQISN
jgi:hypothetical protein